MNSRSFSRVPSFSHVLSKKSGFTENTKSISQEKCIFRIIKWRQNHVLIFWSYTGSQLFFVYSLTFAYIWFCSSSIRGQSSKSKTREKSPRLWNQILNSWNISSRWEIYFPNENSILFLYQRIFSIPIIGRKWIFFWYFLQWKRASSTWNCLILSCSEYSMFIHGAPGNSWYFHVSRGDFLITFVIWAS